MFVGEPMPGSKHPSEGNWKQRHNGNLFRMYPIIYPMSTQQDRCFNFFVWE